LTLIQFSKYGQQNIDISKVNKCQTNKRNEKCKKLVIWLQCIVHFNDKLMITNYSSMEFLQLIDKLKFRTTLIQFKL